MEGRGSPRQTRIALGIIAAIALAFVALALLYPRHDAPATANPYDAWTVCRDAVVGRLKAPATADFPGYRADYVQPAVYGYMVSAYVDADNGFGAHIRTRFTCDVRRQGDALRVEGVTTQ